MASRYETRERFLALVCSGMSLKKAGQAVGVSSPTTVKWWRQSGSVKIKPCRNRFGGLGLKAPVVITGEVARERRMLTIYDRRTIASGIQERLSYAQIGRLIDRDKSVVWREVNRYRAPDGEYYPSVADLVAMVGRWRPKEFKLNSNPSLCRLIEHHIDQGWSPQLIAQVLAADPSIPTTDRVSHETMYRALYEQSRGQLRKDLHKKLSLQRAKRKRRRAHRAHRCGPYQQALTIRDRPAEADDRAVPGHWEGDLILGARNGSAVGTLVERTTRFEMLLHLPNGHDADSVAEAMIRALSKLPPHLRRSLTYDRGTEMARYADVQLAVHMPIYFCDPHSPWQRGSNENHNRLLRFWLPKGSDLSVHTAEDLQRIADTLNNRPRPTLGMKTPAEALAEYHHQQVA